MVPTPFLCQAGKGVQQGGSGPGRGRALARASRGLPARAGARCEARLRLRPRAAGDTLHARHLRLGRGGAAN